MNVLESRILIKIERADKAVEKIGEFVVPVGAGEFDVAIVEAIGPKVEGNINVGDTVYYYPNAGKEFTKNGQKYRVISSSEVIVVIGNED